MKFLDVVSFNMKLDVDDIRELTMASRYQRVFLKHFALSSSQTRLFKKNVLETMHEHDSIAMEHVNLSRAVERFADIHGSVSSAELCGCGAASQP